MLFILQPFLALAFLAQSDFAMQKIIALCQKLFYGKTFKLSRKMKDFSGAVYLPKMKSSAFDKKALGFFAYTARFCSIKRKVFCYDYYSKKRDCPPKN